jgi:hypothetical protein
MHRIVYGLLILIPLGCGEKAPPQAGSRNESQHQRPVPVADITFALRSIDGETLPQYYQDGSCERITYGGTYVLSATSWSSSAEIGGSCYGTDSLRHVRRASGTYSVQGDTLTFVSFDSTRGRTLEMGRAVWRLDTLRYAGPELFDGPPEIYLRKH